MKPQNHRRVSFFRGCGGGLKEGVLTFWGLSSSSEWEAWSEATTRWRQDPTSQI